LRIQFTMIKLLTTYFFIFFASSLLCFSQTSNNSLFSNKTFKATKVVSGPKIDGKLDDDIWKNAEIRDDFIQSDPTEGNSPTYRTEVRVLYDDFAIYIGAMMYDDHPDSILHELGNRDDDLNADNFSVAFDTYNKQQDAFVFSVYASGVQVDYKMSDPTFNAVWESETRILNNGWCVEMKIPYSAIRFPKVEEQFWGVQFTRTIRRTREYDEWSLTPKGKPNPQNYWGTLLGIKDIKEPIRLSFTPHVSTYLQSEPATDENGNLVYSKSLSYTAGADIKYGIDRRFTLDMTLLPDFGQVQSDNRVKNLTPFEIILDENRPFFKEGFDLFNKDKVFYSRRIGRTPTGYYNVINNLQPGESIVDNPSQVQLLNAIKLSGRTNKGLGIGEFNAVTDNTYATIKDANGVTRRVLTEPMADYNVFVLDQNLSNNADIYLINGATIRSKDSVDANVTSTGFNIQDKKHVYELRGGGAITQRFGKNGSSLKDYSDTIGTQYYFMFHKISGNFQFGVSDESTSNNFNRNDLGVSTIYDYTAYNADLIYNVYLPFGIFKQTFNDLNIAKSYIYTTGQQKGISINFNSFTVLNNYWGGDLGGGYVPVKGIDIYEPRVPGRIYISPIFYYFFLQGSSPYQKKIACDFGINYTNTPANNMYELSYSIGPIIKFSNRLSLRHTFTYDHFVNDVGFANFDSLGNSIFGRREIYTITNTLTLKYIFKNDMSLSLRVRHYLSNGVYKQYYTLLSDGTLQTNDVYTTSNDFNSNYFNVDLIYSWQFSPGSSFNIDYKNAIDREFTTSNIDYYQNLQNAINYPQTNTISLQIVYYLDYQYLVKKHQN